MRRCYIDESKNRQRGKPLTQKKLDWSEDWEWRDCVRTWRLGREWKWRKRKGFWRDKHRREKGIRFSSKGSKAKAKESRGKWKGKQVSLSYFSSSHVLERESWESKRWSHFYATHTTQYASFILSATRFSSDCASRSSKRDDVPQSAPSRALSRYQTRRRTQHILLYHF